MKRIFFVVALIAMLLITPIVQAQTNAGQGLEISPPLAELKADPGQTIKSTVRVRNVTEETLVISAEVNDFTAAGEDGQPKLLLEEGEVSPYSIKGWITTISKATLASREQKSVTITMKVPDDASPGGHYGVVRFTGTPPGLEDTGVSLSASVGALILVNISGDVNEDAKIAELFTTQNNKRRWLFEYGPVTLVERIENTGNTHVKPSGTVRVTNMFNREVASFPFNEQGGNVLPASTRKFEQVLNKKLLFGRYKVQADVVYGSENKIISSTITFWAIPYKIIILAVAAVLIIFFGLKKYNKFVVKRANKTSSKK